MEDHYTEYRSPVSKLIKEVSLKPVLYDPHNTMYKDNQARLRAWQQIADKMKMPVTDCQIKWGTLRRCLANARKRQMRREAVGSKNIKKWRHQEEMSFLLPYIDRKEYDYLGSARKRRLNKLTIDFDTNDTSISQDMYISEEYEASDCGDEGSVDVKPQILTLENPLSPRRTAERSSISADEMYIEEDEVDGCSLEVREWANRRQVEHEISSSSREIRTNDLLLDEMDAFFLSMSKALKKLPLIEQIKVRSQVYNTITRAEVNWLSKSPQPTDSIENIPTKTT